MNSRHIALLDFYYGGHHPRYIQMLMHYWAANELKGRLDIVVTNTFTHHHPQIQNEIGQLAHKGIRLIVMDVVPPHASATSTKEIIDNDRMHGQAIATYVKMHKPDHVVILYFDHTQFSLAFDLRINSNTTFSGIYFRPSFHYKYLNHNTLSVKNRLYDFSKKTLLFLSLHNKNLTHLFCLDPYAVPYIKKLSGSVVSVIQPDGVQAFTEEDARYEGSPITLVEEGRKIILLYGAIDGRKGVFQVLNALRKLDIPYQKKMCLVLAGPIHDQEREKIERAIDEANRSTDVQIIVDDQYLETPQIAFYLVAADLVLTTYQHHVGSSNVLIQAAALGKPVLGSNYGVVGAHIRNHGLGRAIEASSPDEIAEALNDFLEHPESFAFDRTSARRFAQEHTAEKFAETIFSHIGCETIQSPRQNPAVNV